MVVVWIDRSVNRIKLQTDDPSVKFLLESTHWDIRYSPWKKKVVNTLITEKIYDEKKVVPVNGIFTFTLGLGWAAYIANTFKDYLNLDDYNSLVNVIVASSYRTTPFPELRNYQNEDVLHLLKYKIGLYGVYTGYGEWLLNLLNY